MISEIRQDLEYTYIEDQKIDKQKRKPESDEQLVVSFVVTAIIEFHWFRILFKLNSRIRNHKNGSQRGHSIGGPFWEYN